MKNYKTETDYFTSEEHKKLFQDQVKRDTWDKGLPMVYANKKGEIVKHWKDGKIEIIGNI